MNYYLDSDENRNAVILGYHEVEFEEKEEGAKLAESTNSDTYVGGTQEEEVETDEVEEFRPSEEPELIESSRYCLPAELSLQISSLKWNSDFQGFNLIESFSKQR